MEPGRLQARIARIRRATVDRHPPMPCPNPECRCTHEPPCFAGWIENSLDPGGYDSVRPCPICRPEAARIINDGGGMQPRLRKRTES